MNFDGCIRVVCDANLETCDSRMILEAFKRSVVGSRALTCCFKETIVGRLPDA